MATHTKFDRQGHSCNFYGGLGPTNHFAQRSLKNSCGEAAAIACGGACLWHASAAQGRRASVPTTTAWPQPFSGRPPGVRTAPGQRLDSGLTLSTKRPDSVGTALALQLAIVWAAFKQHPDSVWAARRQHPDTIWTALRQRQSIAGTTHKRRLGSAGTTPALRLRGVRRGSGWRRGSATTCLGSV